MPLANSARVRQLPLAEEIRLTNVLEVEGNRTRNPSCTSRGYSRVRGNTKVNSCRSSSSYNLVFILDANSMSGAKDRVTYHRFSAEMSSSWVPPSGMLLELLLWPVASVFAVCVVVVE